MEVPHVRSSVKLPLYVLSSFSTYTNSIFTRKQRDISKFYRIGSVNFAKSLDNQVLQH